MHVKKTPVVDPALMITVDRPVRTGRVVLISIAAGILLAILWSYELVDSVIGDNIANQLLGHDARATAVTGTTAGLLFAFVSGLAGTFTACNVAVAASVGPLGQASQQQRPQRPDGVARTLLRAVGYLTLGMVVVSALYGSVGVLVGDRLPQLSTDTVGGMPVRLIQSSVVFGVIGLALTYLGLAALKIVPDIFARRPVARVVTLGALIGGFLIGRPYPLFRKLFEWTVETGNPLYGAFAFVLQSLGNIAVVAILFTLLAVLSRGRFLRWLSSDPRRSMLISGSLLLALGVFTVVYWVIRVPAMFGFGWFPTMFYN
ncbi:MAG TPA: hypothetical protein VFX61_02885 [Micromonosporaceae bacterium]|nr:hypothetical protein [Micromonosporaceae bacterium]